MAKKTDVKYKSYHLKLYFLDNYYRSHVAAYEKSYYALLIGAITDTFSDI